MNHDRNCVTYRHAYVAGESTLCSLCREQLERDPDSMPDVPVLGAVQHGQHEASCDLDDDEAT